MTKDRKTDAYLYHATRAIRMPSIAREGLTPNTDRDPTFDGYPVNGRLYVATTEDGAAFYANTLRHSFGVKTAILRFPASMAHIRNDEFGNPQDRYTIDAVPPDAIEIRKGMKWIALNSMRPAGPKQAPLPDFDIGLLSVFRTGNRLDVTDDGLPVNDGCTNLVVRLVVDGSRLLDAATPRLKQFQEPVIELLRYLGMVSIEGRALTLFDYNGIRYQADAPEDMETESAPGRR